jgi:hypothetical protein
MSNTYIYAIDQLMIRVIVMPKPIRIVNRENCFNAKFKKKYGFYRPVIPASIDKRLYSLL